MSKAYKYFLNIFLLFLILSDYCSSQTLDSKINPNNEKSLIPISVQLKWKHQFQFAGYYAAKYKGFYAEEGLDVTIYEGNRQEDPIKNVLSGKVDFGISDVDVLFSKMKGNPLVVIAAIFQHSHHILLTKKSSHIRKPSDLIGKKIMISDYIGVAQLKSIFFREGIPIDSIKVISDHWDFNALVEDSVDVITGYINDHPYKLQKLGYEPFVLHSEDYGIDFYGDLLFTSENKIERDLKQVISFKRATIKGWEYAITHIDEVIDYILKNTDAEIRGITREKLVYEADYIKQITLYGYVDIGHINPGRFESMAKAIWDLGLIKEEYSLKGLIFNPDSDSNEKYFRIVGISAIILLVVFGLSVFLIYRFRKMVKRRTKDLEEEIKQRKLFEDTLVRSEARYKSLFEYAPLNILEQDFSEVKIFIDEIKSKVNSSLKEYLMNHPDVLMACSKKIIYTDINEEACKFFAVKDKDEYRKQENTYFQVLSPDSFLNHILSIANNETQFDAEITFKLNNGDIKIMIMRTSVPSGYEKNYKKVLVSLVDITERKKIEEALFASEKNFKTLSHEFQSILNAVPDAIIVLDTDKKITWMNYFASEVLNSKSFGKDPNYCCKLLFDQELPCEECLIVASKTEKSSRNKEFSTKDGKIWEMRTVPILDEQNELISMIILIRDTTIKKKAEEEMLKQEKIESVGVLAGGIAHDFNNLLTAVLGNISLSKLMIGKGKDEKIEKYLGSAEKATLRAKDLTYQLLTFSKGGAPIKKKTSLYDVIKDSANFVLRGSKNKLESVIPENLWNVEIDEGQISQVVQNLVINADQAMEKPGVISIFCENVSIGSEEGTGLDKGRYVKVSVVDAGMGIPDELKTKIFDPYFTTKEKGNGLGLATSYSIIKKHLGYLTVESEVGKGAQFTFYLPAVKSIDGIETNEQDDLILGKGNILIVDDEEMVRELLSDILINIGYQVNAFADGNSALVQYEKMMNINPFDLVITDLTIPGGIGGKDLLDRLLKIDSEAKVIVSSGYSNDPLMAEFKKFGFKAVISKPYIVSDLSRTIASVMNK